MLNNRGYSMSSHNKNGNFAEWMERRQSQLESGQGVESIEESSTFFTLTSFAAIQDTLSSQLQELGGDMPLSSAFRARAVHAIYLLCGSLIFLIIAIVVGLPTLLVRPSKFVICISLSTLLGASSVVVLQKPSVFISSILNGGMEKGFPVVLLLLSLFTTLYVTIFIHKYLYVIIMGSLQMWVLLYYLSSFIPGGSQGLAILLRTGYAVVSTAITPCIYVCKRTVYNTIKSVFS